MSLGVRVNVNTTIFAGSIKILYSINGKKVRTYTYEPTDEGTYTFKVKAYKKVDGKKVWGSASKSVKVTVE